MRSQRFARFCGSRPVRGLVEEQHPGCVDDPEGHVEAPALPARVGPHPPVGELCQVEQSEQILHAAHDIGLRGAVEATLQEEVLASGGQLVGASELAHVADPAADLLGLASYVEAGDAAPGRRQSGARS